MDTQRIVLLLVFTVSLFLLHDAWQRQHVVPQPTTAAGTQAAGAATDAAGAKIGDVPAPSRPAGTPGALPSAPQAENLAAGESVEVVTDVIHAQISTAGGDLRRLELLKQADDEDLKKIVPAPRGSARTNLSRAVGFDRRRSAESQDSLDSAGEDVPASARGGCPGGATGRLRWRRPSHEDLPLPPRLVPDRTGP